MKTVTIKGLKNQTIQVFSEAEAQGLSILLTQLAESVDKFVIPDRGTCIMGNGIFVWVVPARCRKPVKKRIFRNIWSQGEQEVALRKLIELAEEHFPEYKGLIHYDHGVMD